MSDKQHLNKWTEKPTKCILGDVKEANYSLAFEITLIQRAMIQASYNTFTCVISLLLTLVHGCASNSYSSNDITLVA